MSMGGGSKKGSTTAEPYINVTPLIDVLLVLLIKHRASAASVLALRRGSAS